MALMAKSRLHAAHVDLKAIRDDVKEIRENLNKAEVGEWIAEQEIGDAKRARERLDDIKTVIADHLEKLASNPEYALACAKALISAYRWNGISNYTEIAGYVLDLVPSLEWKTIINLIPNSGYYSNKQVADLLGVTYDTRQRLGLRQFRACDLSYEGFDQRQADRKKHKNRESAAEKRRAKGMPTIDQRKAIQAARSEYVKRLARERGISTSTIYRRIAQGKIPEYTPCESGISTSSTINGYSTFAKAQGGKPLKGAASLSVVSGNEYRSDALTGLRPDAYRPSPSQKNTPVVSDKGIAKLNIHDQFYSTMLRITEAIASAPLCIDRVINNVASAAGQFAASEKRRAANG